MIIFDAHCDTITRIMEIGGSIKTNACHVDVDRMKRTGSYVQMFAAFIEPLYYQGNAMKRAVQIIDRLYREIKEYNDDIMLCCNYNEIEAAMNEDKAAAMLSIEGGEALEGDLSALRIFYKLGVRSLCLTWNYRNEIADGASDSISGGGLTSFGRQVIKEMNSLGMMVDVSHLSEKGFWDVVETTKAPIIASHSNARNVYDHVRNLKDEQIIALKKNGGVMGINFYPLFLNGSEKAAVKDIVKHIEYIAALAGCKHIGIGADFDGISYTPSDVKGVQDMGKVFEELAKLNYLEEDISGIAGENFLRIVKSVC